MTIKIPDVATIIRMHVTKALPRLLATGRVDLANYNPAQIEELKAAGVDIPGLNDAVPAAPAAAPVAVETTPKRGDDPHDIAAAAKELAGVIPLPSGMVESVCEKYNVFPFQVAVENMGFAMDSDLDAFRPKGAKETQRKLGGELKALGFSPVQIQRMTKETMESLCGDIVLAADCSILPNGGYQTFSAPAAVEAPAPVAAPALSAYEEPEEVKDLSPPTSPYLEAAALFDMNVDSWKAAIRKAGISGRVTSRFISKALKEGDIQYALVDGVLQPLGSPAPSPVVAPAPVETPAAVLEDIMTPDAPAPAPAPALEQEKAPVLYLSWGVSGTKLLLDGRLAEIVNFAKEIGVDLRI